MEIMPGNQRPAAQAGRFYEADPERLRRHIAALLSEHSAITPHPEAIAILAPHAGYAYSGQVAAAAYAVVQGREVDRVLILAPSHFADFRGAALPPSTAFATPLGEVAVDQAAAAALATHPLFVINKEAHATEHSIEVQLPFQQVVLPTPFAIVPVLLGGIDAGDLDVIAQRLASFIQARQDEGERWLIVASSDTYHGYDADACRENDLRLEALVETMDEADLYKSAHEHRVMACGWAPLIVTMKLAARFGAARGEVLFRADSRSPHSRPGDYVVGYLAAYFH